MATDQNLIDALGAVVAKAEATAQSSTPEELVYLGKALEAVGPASTTRYIVEIGESERARVTAAGDKKIAEINSGLKTINGNAILGSGNISLPQNFLGSAYLATNTTEVTSGRVNILTLSYTKKSSTSKLVCHTFMNGEFSHHDHRIRAWNSVDGYYSDGSTGQNNYSLKLSQPYHGDNQDSTPGNAMHIGVGAVGAPAGTAVEFTWYVTNHTVAFNRSWQGSHEAGKSWMYIEEVED